MAGDSKESGIEKPIAVSLQTLETLLNLANFIKTTARNNEIILDSLLKNVLRQDLKKVLNMVMVFGY